MRIGSLRHRITIQERLGLVFQDFAKVWSSIEPISANEKLERADMEQSNTHRIRIRFRRGLTSTMRIIYKDRLFSVESIIDPKERQKELELICEELLPLVDTITIKRKQKIRGPQNVVTSKTIERQTKACILETTSTHSQAGHDPIQWQQTVTFHVELSEDVIKGDYIEVPDKGVFFVTEADRKKHFLVGVAVQEKRGAEQNGSSAIRA
ncbi:phage head closure protein [Brevibacillus laterosporus]|uniref:phage head closure protein n=1 Tax=Brevibacillus laterosporus TaxID=1465 RepID=UPI0003B1ACEF|nr:phage head closure protein [Brevibacillus laterosporus]ERM17343.1 hypothetical protein P615_21395 [Brevibacillus laterosporus PE36]